MFFLSLATLAWLRIGIISSLESAKKSFVFFFEYLCSAGTAKLPQARGASAGHLVGEASEKERFDLPSGSFPRNNLGLALPVPDGTEAPVV